MAQLSPCPQTQLPLLASCSLGETKLWRWGNHDTGAVMGCTPASSVALEGARPRPLCAGYHSAALGRGAGSQRGQLQRPAAPPPGPRSTAGSAMDRFVRPQHVVEGLSPGLEPAVRTDGCAALPTALVLAHVFADHDRSPPSTALSFPQPNFAQNLSPLAVCAKPVTIGGLQDYTTVPVPALLVTAAPGTRPETGWWQAVPLPMHPMYTMWKPEPCYCRCLSGRGLTQAHHVTCQMRFLGVHTPTM